MLSYYIIHTTERYPSIDGPYIHCGPDQDEQLLVVEPKTLYFSMSGKLYYNYNGIIYSANIFAGKVPDYIKGFERFTLKSGKQHIQLEADGGIDHQLLAVYSSDPFFMRTENVDDYLKAPRMLAAILNIINYPVAEDLKIYAVLHETHCEFHYHDIVRKLRFDSFYNLISIFRIHQCFEHFLLRNEREPDTEFLQL